MGSLISKPTPCTMKSLFVIAVAGAIFALCSVGVEGHQPSLHQMYQRGPGGQGNRPSRNCTSDDECGRRGRNGTCYSNLCFPSCASNDERSGRYDVCDTDNSRCVMCNVNADCSGDDDTCENNRCVTSCASDDECSGRYSVCNTDTSTCVMCNVNADCTRGRVCNTDKGRCVMCNTDDDCSGDDGTCENNHCVTSCDSDNECSGRYGVCNTDTSRCVMCNVDGDCRRGRVCNTDTNRCRRRRG